MGIKPAGTTPIIVPPDNVQSRWGEYEASLDTAGQQGGEVVVEIYSIAESASTAVDHLSGQVFGLLEDSAAIGDESKTIQQQMRELLDPDNPDSELWEMQSEINKLNDDRNDLQDQMIEMNRSSMDSLAEYVSRSIFIPQATPVSDDYFTITNAPGTSHRWRVTAKPGWVGNYVWQSVYYFTTGDASPVIDGREVGFTREWDEYAWNRTASILTYWVKKAQYFKDDRVGSGYTTDPGAWTQSPGLSFTVTETALHDLFYQVKWGGADRGTTYGHRITRNGEVLFQWGLTSNMGPMWPWESGTRTRGINEFKVPLNAGDVLEFETYSNGSTASTRALASAERKLGWIIEPVEN